CHHLTERCMETIKTLPLRVLVLTGNSIDSVSLLDLQGMPLQSLNLRNCPLIEQMGRAEMQIVKKLPLTSLKCSYATDEGVQELANSRIEDLSIPGEGITDNSVQYLK